MRYLDMRSWPRRQHFDVYNAFDHPHFGLCANMDITAFQQAVRAWRGSFTIGITYVLARSANAIPEFRYRIRGDQVVEHEVVHPSITILTADDLFTFCHIRYDEQFARFAAQAEQAIAYRKAHLTLEDGPGQDDLLFMSSIPWVSFTGLLHPIHEHPVDSVPRIAWGKYYTEGERLKLPLSVQAHHAVMDGVHMGRYYMHVQELLDRPADYLGVGQADSLPHGLVFGGTT